MRKLLTYGMKHWQALSLRGKVISGFVAALTIVIAATIVIGAIVGAKIERR